MENKDHVSFEVAKLLKEKGYDHPCDSFFEDNPDCLICWGCLHELKKEVAEDEYLQPTLYDAQKWLREDYLLHIEVGIANDCSEDADGNVVDSWDFWCYTIYYTTNISYHLADSKGEFESYEEALNEGIKEALKYI